MQQELLLSSLCQSLIKGAVGFILATGISQHDTKVKPLLTPRSCFTTQELQR